MSCSGCAERREWIKKWLKIAYERATGKRTDSSITRTDDSAKGTNDCDKQSG